MQTTAQQRARALAASDLKQIFTRSEIWRALAFNDIRSKYRLSTFGSLWIAMSTAVLAVSIGLIYGQFFGQDVAKYLPYFTAGFIVWTYIASVINEATTILTASAPWIKASNLPISFYVMRMLQRNLIVFLHNAVILFLIWLYLQWTVTWFVLTVVPAFLLLHVFLAAASIIIAVVCVRYRDIPPMIGAVTQFLFFATPIIWYPEQLRFGKLILILNPATYFISIVRDPLLGRPVEWYAWAVSFGIVAITVAAAVWVYLRYRSRIVYWV